MIRIRRAIPENAQKIISFQQAMAMETEGLKLNETILGKGVKAVFDDPSKGEYFVAESEGSVIASLLITYEWSDWRNSNVWWFQSVYVVPRFRRKGIFRMMYLFIKNEAERLGVAGLRLYVEKNNSAARKTYEAMDMTSEHYTMYEWLKNS
jgi:GNAT superfamily N-acetyltransferase